ncbi:MAG: efflux RND transporter permease subunit [Syntrophomonadaceae bacterium]|nr:efflux RND transporter permease subunit [Syntrophomonadaceae bacterium]
MKIANFSVKRPVTITIVVAVLMILGLFTFSRMPVDLLPEMDIPVALVMTSYPGAGPEEVESQITKTIESSLASLSNVSEIQSISSSGSSMVIIMFNWGANLDSAVLDIRESIGMIEGYLPSGAEKPMVLKIDPTIMPILQMGISGGENLAQLQDIAEDLIEPRLTRIPEVASVIITGGYEREVQVELDPVKLENYGLSISQVTNLLMAENFNVSSGKVEQGGRNYYVRNLQQFETIEDIKNVALITNTGNTLYLKDIATVTDGHKERAQLTRVNGEEAVGIHIMKQSDANTVQACEAVLKEMAKIKEELGVDIEYNVVMNQADYVNASINNTLKMILEGSILAMLVLFLFLRNMRSTLIIFTAIPLSIIATFIMMYFTNNTVNLITMGALALGIGRIIDDSIVVFENIYRHREMGTPAMEAAIKGTNEVSGAVIATTTSIIAVFIPMVFVEGIASILFKPMALTVSMSIFCSLIVALTVIPLMSSKILTDKAMEKKNNRIANSTRKFGDWIDNLGEYYKVILAKILQKRRKAVVIVTLLTVGSLVLIPFIGAEFMPDMDSGEISIAIETDKGSKLVDAEAIVLQVEEQLRTVEEVDIIFCSVGSSSNMMMSSDSADNSTIYVKLVPLSERSRDVSTVAEEIRNKMVDIAGAKISVGVMDMSSSMGGSSSSPINVQIRGDDLEILKELSDEVANIVKNIPGTREVESSLGDGQPEVQVKIDRQRAAAYGLTPMQISNEVRGAIAGTIASRYKVDGEEIDIRVKYPSTEYKDLDYLANIPIQTPMGTYVKLSQVATFEVAQGPVAINRTDQVRIATVSASLLNRDLMSVIADIKAEVDKIALPAGYTIEFAGQDEEMMESFASLAIALLLAIILVYSVMAIQYESFFNPFIIMFSVPTSIIGVVLALLVTGTSFSVNAFMGVIMLVGIVVANAIVFVDYLKQLIARGMDRDEAILEAGRVRLRPILMTALCTILAMMPLALGIGEGAEAQAPMGIVVIGGLLASTVLTLVLVPVMYSILDDWGQNMRRKFGLSTAAEDDTDVTA